MSGLCSSGQSINKLKIIGDYSTADSIQVTMAYMTAYESIKGMHLAMDEIWYATPKPGQSKKSARIEKWESNRNFSKWLGNSDQFGRAHRTINRIHSKFTKRITLEVTKENKGKCKGWIGAWTIPYGNVKIRLCEEYFIYGGQLKEKILVHEMGHEAGLLFHHRIHYCYAAQRAAKQTQHNIAKKNPENYAWLAMSYLGITCSY
jgi:hypothetical protein